MSQPQPLTLPELVAQGDALTTRWTTYRCGRSQRTWQSGS